MLRRIGLERKCTILIYCKELRHSIYILRRFIYLPKSPMPKSPISGQNNHKWLIVASGAKLRGENYRSQNCKPPDRFALLSFPRV